MASKRALRMGGGLGLAIYWCACTPSFSTEEGDGGEAGAGKPGAPQAGDAGRAASAGAGAAGGSPGSGGTSGTTSLGAGMGASGGSGGAAGAGGSSGGMNPGASGGSDAHGGEHGGGDTSGSGGALAGSGGTAGDVAMGGMPGAGSGGVAGTLVVSGGRPSGGSSGTAGQGSAGGPPVVVSCSSVLQVDDLEDGDDLVCPNQGRSGEWWAATGTLTGTTDPSEMGEFDAYSLVGADARAGSLYGMHLSGTGFGHTDDDWASLGFYLAGGSAYDVSAREGLAFYAKSKSGELKLHVTFATYTTTPTDEGGTCLSDCNDHYSAPVTLDATWKEFKVPLASLAQEGWGEKPEDLAHTLFVYFGFLGTDGGAASFDFLIDDVRLY